MKRATLRLSRAALCLAGLWAAAPAPAQTAPPAGPSADPTQVRPGRYVLDPAHGTITWSLSHFGFSVFYGQFTAVAATLTLDPKAPAASRLAAEVAVSEIGGVGEALSQRLREPDFFDSTRFPKASFSSTQVEPTGPTTARVTGDLTLKGVTKPVVLDVTFTLAGPHPLDHRYTVGFEGRTVLKRSEFGVSAYAPQLGDEVTLRLAGEFKAEP
ncbi:YceI family protein [Methylobacterium oryzihabitans]|uniref:YceI family protein n=1 Tax=Methylobacterium oryzihabitans TaxID=2499852 RepID=A0A437PD15_9HYPH|nr:YceI family protein [Methylobacterium oryzihabitans]RVU20151.1 YceI family protein [Methylobacterium oryzihabitans]